MAEKRFYDDYGRTYDEAKQPVAVSAVGNPYGFQGRRFDPETGLYYYRNRYYDPETGRFLQRDPIWDAMNVGNLYTFVGNGPVSGQDALGLGDPYHDLEDAFINRTQELTEESVKKLVRLFRNRAESDMFTASQDPIKSIAHGAKTSKALRAALEEAATKDSKLSKIAQEAFDDIPPIR